MIDYPFTIRHLSKDEGGGYLAEAFDLNGCMADGETIEEAVSNLEEAIYSWVKTAQEFGDFVPTPSDDRQFSGKWVVRTTKSIHHRLVEMAKREGVSLNTMTVSILAEGIGNKSAHHP